MTLRKTALRVFDWLGEMVEVCDVRLEWYELFLTFSHARSIIKLCFKCCKKTSKGEQNILTDDVAYTFEWVIEDERTHK